MHELMSHHNQQIKLFLKYKSQLTKGVGKVYVIE